MVNDTLAEPEETENLQPAENSEADFVDTASDLKDLYKTYSSEDNGNGESSKESMKDNAKPDNVSSARDTQDTTQAVGDTGEKLAEGADDATDTAKVARGRNMAGYVGGRIGEGVGEKTAETLGGDKDVGGEVGERGGEAGGTALYDKYKAGKTPPTGGEAGDAATGGAPATPTVAPAASATPAPGAPTAPLATPAVAPTAAATPVAGAATPAVGTAVAPLASATPVAAGGGTAAAGGTAVAGASIAWPVVVIILAAILILIIILIIVAIVAPRLSSDKDDPENQQAIASIESSVRSGKIVFNIPSDDLEKIKNYEIGTPALQTIDNLSKLHEQIQIHYTGIREYVPGKTKVNDSFEFDIVAVDKIKCTDTANNTKLTEFPIYLNLNYDWKSLVMPAYSDKVICAVGYYPQIEPPVYTAYKEQFSPGEFPIQQLPEKAKMAVQEKTAQLIEEITSQGKSVSAGSDPYEVLPASLTFDQLVAERNLKKSTAEGISTVLTEKIKQMYPDTTYKPLDPIKNYNGLHVSFL